MLGKKEEREKERQRIYEEGQKQVAKMKFKVDMFYNDLSKPYFEAGKVYEVKGADKIQRWLKRGGEIVEGDMSLNQSEPPKPVEHPEEPTEAMEHVDSQDEKTEDDHEDKKHHGKKHHGHKKSHK